MEGYKGKISNAGTQVVKAPAQKEAPKAKTVIKKGGSKNSK